MPDTSQAILQRSMMIHSSPEVNEILFFLLFSAKLLIRSASRAMAADGQSDADDWPVSGVRVSGQVGRTVFNEAPTAFQHSNCHGRLQLRHGSPEPVSFCEVGHLRMVWQLQLPLPASRLQPGVH